MAHRNRPARSPQPPIADLDDLERHLSLPSQFDQTGVHHGYRQSTIVHGGCTANHDLAHLIGDTHPVREAWLSWIEPGGFIVCHIDGGPHYDRWQYPITDAGTLNGTPTGIEPYRVFHDRWHHVRNDTDEPRVVVVVDRNEIRNPQRSPFVVCPNGPTCISDHD